MIEVLDDTSSNILEFRLSGVVTAKDYEEVLIPTIENKLKSYPKIRVLYQVTDKFDSYELGAMLDDAKAGLLFFNAWEKIAVVSDVDWIINGVKAFSFMVPGVVKTFSNSKLKEAREWLRAKNINLDVSFSDKDKIVTLEPKGELTKDDFKYAKEIIDPLIEKYEKLNGIIIHTKDFPGWASFGALINHLEFIKEHHKHIKKLAFVTNSVVGELAQKVGSHFVNAEVKNFDYEQLDNAKKWIVN